MLDITVYGTSLQDIQLTISCLQILGKGHYSRKHDVHEKVHKRRLII